MQPEFILLLIGLFIILFIVILTIINKRNAKKKIEAEKQAKAQKKEETIKKFCKNPIINQWAMEIATIINNVIKENPLREYKFHLRAYNQDLVFGIFLRTIKYKALGTYKNEPHRETWLAYHFAEYELPALESKELSLLEIAVSDIIKNLLLKNNTTIKYQQEPLFIDPYTSMRAEDTDNDNLTTIIYIPPKPQGTW